jgi:hypothetical protein
VSARVEQDPLHGDLLVLDSELEVRRLAELVVRHLSVSHTRRLLAQREKEKVEREAHEAFLKEYEAHFSESRDEATARELGIVTKQAKKLETRTTFKETKASDLSGSTLRNLIERTASRVE